MTTAIGTIFKNTACILTLWWRICSVARASGFLGSRPHRWLTASRRLGLLVSVSLACFVDTLYLLCRVLIGMRCFELCRWKRLGKQHPIIIPCKARRGSGGWLLSYCSSHRSLLIALHSALAVKAGKQERSSPSQGYFWIDPLNCPNHQWPIFLLICDSVILYRCQNSFFQLASNPVGYGP